MNDGTPFLILGWIASNPLQVFTVAGPIVGAVFWLAHANYRAYQKLILTFGFAFYINAGFASLMLFIGLWFDVSWVARSFLEVTVVPTAEVSQIVSPVEIENILQSHAKIQWIVFILAVVLAITVVFIAARDIFKPDDQEPDV